MPDVSKGGSSEQLANGFLVGDRLVGIRLAKPFLYLRKEAEPFDGIFERRVLWQSFNSLKDLLFRSLSTHGQHSSVWGSLSCLA